MRRESIHNDLVFTWGFIIIKEANFIFLYPSNLKCASKKHSELFREGEENRYKGIQSYISSDGFFPT